MIDRCSAKLVIIAPAIAVEVDGFQDLAPVAFLMEVLIVVQDSIFKLPLRNYSIFVVVEDFEDSVTLFPLIFWLEIESQSNGNEDLHELGRL